MYREKQGFIFAFCGRYLCLLLVLGGIYLIHGGKLGVFAHFWPLSFVASFVGLFFLMSGGRFPEDWSSLTEIAQFRSLAWKVMWCLNTILFFASNIMTLGRLSEGNEVIAAGVAEALATTVLNSMFYLSVILVGRKKPGVSGDPAKPGGRFHLRFRKVTYGLGQAAWVFLVILVIVLGFESLKPRYQRDLRWDAEELATNRMKVVEEEFIRKNCRSMTRGEYMERHNVFKAEELRKLKQASEVKK